jgi:Cu+-exporting ATPase
MRTTQLRLQGLNGTTCANTLQAMLQNVPGVARVDVNFSAERAAVDFDPQRITVTQLQQAIRQAGYIALLERESAVAVADEPQQVSALRLHLLSLRLGLSTICTVFLVANAALAFGGWPLPAWTRWPTDQWVQLGVAAFVQFAVGLPFYIEALAACRRRLADTSVLLVLGTTSAFALSLAAQLFPAEFAAQGMEPYLYYAVAATAMTLAVLGRRLEAGDRREARVAARHLHRLQAQTARVLRHGHESTVPATQVQVTDVMAVRPGETIPADGVVIAGSASVREGAVTGQNSRRSKQVGDEVLAASHNLKESFKFRATRVGKDTVLAQIVRLAEDVRDAKAPIRHLANWIASLYVPIVLAVAIATVAIWFNANGNWTAAAVTAVSTVAIAGCSAIAIATPLPIAIGAAKAVRNGTVLTQGAYSLTLAGQVDTVVVGKTATLTRGLPEVVDCVAVRGNQLQLVRWAAAAERHVEHPLAEAVVHYAKAQAVSLPSVQEFSVLDGCGVEATVEGRRVAIGSARWLERLGISTIAIERYRLQWEAEGKSTLYLAADCQLMGAFSILDPLKPTSPAAIRALKRMGLEVVLLTGDSEPAANAIAQQLGIDRAIAEVPQNQKAEQVKFLQLEGRHVAMVGDGTIDAPGLQQANAGIAIGPRTDAAFAASDIALVADDLQGAVTAIRLSRATVRNVYQNLAIALVFNAAAIPLATGILYPSFGWSLNPSVAGMAIAFSTILIILNALRLKCFRARKR